VTAPKLNVSQHLKECGCRGIIRPLRLRLERQGAVRQRLSVVVTSRGAMEVRQISKSYGKAQRLGESFPDRYCAAVQLLCLRKITAVLEGHTQIVEAPGYRSRVPESFSLLQRTTEGSLRFGVSPLCLKLVAGCHQLLPSSTLPESAQRQQRA
jgi:hypothetical protein